MSLTLTAPPIAEPVSLAELKEHLRIEHSAEDALIAGLGLAARQTIEARWRIAMAAQSWRLTLDQAPDCAVALPISPVISIDAVGIVRNGIANALPAGAYDAQTGNLGRVRLKTAAPGGESFAGLVVSFTAGWPSIGEIPEPLKHAIRILTAHLYENREGETGAADVAGLIAPYRQVRL
ncbi:MAG: head-tail connector protein [Parvularculaceae bacterium]|nr:head-tail connector protein [Parvularculaceae bacterium]